MANERKKPADTGVVSRLANRGEDAITRLMDELGRNAVVTDALARAMSAKGVVDERTRKTLATMGLAAADEINDLRGRLERLEQRLSRLERRETGTTARRTSGRKTGTTRKSTGSTSKKSSGSTKRSTSSRDSGSSSGSASGDSSS